MSFPTKEFIAPFSLSNRMRKYLRVETFFIPSWFLSGKREEGDMSLSQREGGRKTTAVELFLWVILLGDREKGKTNEYRSPCKEREAGRWGGQWRRRKKVMGKGRFAIAEFFYHNQKNVAVIPSVHNTERLPCRNVWYKNTHLFEHGLPANRSPPGLGEVVSFYTVCLASSWGREERGRRVVYGRSTGRDHANRPRVLSQTRKRLILRESG